MAAASICVNPRAVVPQSIMPGYPLPRQDRARRAGDRQVTLKANRIGGVPYTDDDGCNSQEDLRRRSMPG